LEFLVSFNLKQVTAIGSMIEKLKDVMRTM